MIASSYDFGVLEYWSSFFTNKTKQIENQQPATDPLCIFSHSFSPKYTAHVFLFIFIFSFTKPIFFNSLPNFITNNIKPDTTDAEIKEISDKMGHSPEMFRGYKWIKGGAKGAFEVGGEE